MHAPARALMHAPARLRPCVGRWGCAAAMAHLTAKCEANVGSSCSALLRATVKLKREPRCAVLCCAVLRSPAEEVHRRTDQRRRVRVARGRCHAHRAWRRHQRPPPKSGAHRCKARSRPWHGPMRCMGMCGRCHCAWTRVSRCIHSATVGKSAAFRMRQYMRICIRRGTLRTKA